MNAHAKEKRLLREENARAWSTVDAHSDVIDALTDVIYGLAAKMKCMEECIAQNHKQITNLTHQLAIYTNADSPSGKDPQKYQQTKKFLADANKGNATPDDTKNQTDDTTSQTTSGAKSGAKSVAKPCGGRPGHQGKSHNMKSSHTIRYTASICDMCGNTELEILPPINKLVTGFGAPNDRMGDNKSAYTIVVRFGWCDRCEDVVDPTQHQVWGTWMESDPLSTVIHYKSNPLSRSATQDNLLVLHRFDTSAGGISNAMTAFADNLEDRVLPASVVAFIKAKRAAKQHHTIASEVYSPAFPTLKPVPIEKKAKYHVPYAQTPQGMTDARLTTTSSYLAHHMSFMEWCREYHTISPYLGADESKVVVAGEWCHGIVSVSPRVSMIDVQSHKNTKIINWLFGGMQHVCVVHDRIGIYNGFRGMHQECWAHLLRRFLRPSIICGLGSPEYARYETILAIYKRAQHISYDIAKHLGIPTNAAEVATYRYKLDKIWHLFESEYDGITNALYGLVSDLNGEEPGGYLKNMLPRALTFVKHPGIPGTNNGTEGIIRWHVVRPRHVFVALPNWRAARNYGMIQTFAATCRKNGSTPYHAVLAYGRDPQWNLFTHMAHPPIFPHMAAVSA